MDQYSPEIDPHILVCMYSQLIFNKVPMHFNEEREFSNNRAVMTG